MATELKPLEIRPPGSWAKTPLAPVHAEELSRFADWVLNLAMGKADPEDFKKFRLENGVYGIRFKDDEHMIRIKIRFGRLTPDQIEAVADVADQFTPLRLGHVTTRQAIQVHNLKRIQVPAALRMLAESGLTTREACGNTVRNVTACPYAGTSPEEPFDVSPYADALSTYLLRNLVNQNLPRKFKIAFEGCRTDHIRVPIHDLGFVAKMRDGKRGFLVTVGGGLGATPMSAQVIDEFLPPEDIFVVAETILRIFDRHGNREDKARARIKFVVKTWGLEKFKKVYEAEKKVTLATWSGDQMLKVQKGLEFLAHWKEEGPPDVDVSRVGAASSPPASDSDYLRWKSTNAKPQKQTGYFAVVIRCPLGDVTSHQMRAVAAIARRYCGGRIRTMITQNLTLQWVPEKALPAVYAHLQEFGLGQHSAETVADITRCPGADTCNLAITHSRGLAAALTPVMANGLGSAEEVRNVSIKISGCFNSCAQHHIADIGFYGSSKSVNGHEVPHYALLLGGGTSLDGGAVFGRVTAQIPAKRVPEAVQGFLEFYKAERQGQETVRQFIDRIGLPRVKAVLEPYQTVPPFEQDPTAYEDLGAEGTLFKMEMGKGECAA